MLNVFVCFEFHGYSHCIESVFGFVSSISSSVHLVSLLASREFGAFHKIADKGHISLYLLGVRNNMILIFLALFFFLFSVFLLFLCIFSVFSIFF